MVSREFLGKFIYISAKPIYIKKIIVEVSGHEDRGEDSGGNGEGKEERRRKKNGGNQEKN